MNKFYIGDICWVISDEEYHEFALPGHRRGIPYYGSDFITRGDSKSGPWETIDFLTTDATVAGWPQDSGVLGVLRFDDLEPEYQERAERLAEGGYVAIFESEARGVMELTVVELMAQDFYESGMTDEEAEEFYGVFDD